MPTRGSVGISDGRPDQSVVWHLCALVPMCFGVWRTVQFSRSDGPGHLPPLGGRSPCPVRPLWHRTASLINPVATFFHSFKGPPRRAGGLRDPSPEGHRNACARIPQYVYECQTCRPKALHKGTALPLGARAQQPASGPTAAPWGALWRIGQHCLHPHGGRRPRGRSGRPAIGLWADRLWMLLCRMGLWATGHRSDSRPTGDRLRADRPSLRAPLHGLTGQHARPRIAFERMSGAFAWQCVNARIPGRLSVHARMHECVTLAHLFIHTRMHTQARG